ncbi:hypothetical protein ACFPRL_03935 [Pseudoclavibacter helvolus]
MPAYRVGQWVASCLVAPLDLDELPPEGSSQNSWDMHPNAGSGSRWPTSSTSVALFVRTWALPCVQCWP